MRSLVPSCLALSLALSWAPLAHSDPPTKREIAQGRERAVKGVEHFKASRWSEARDNFRQALAVQETVVILYYLAVCEERLGDLREARRRLKRAHLLAASGESGESIQTRVGVIDDMRELIAMIDSKLAKITFRWQPAQPEGATLAVGDETIAVNDVANEPLWLNPGEYKVRATAPGRKPYEMSFRFEKGEEREVVLALEPDAPAPAPVVRHDAPPAPPPPPPEGGWQRPVGYVGLGLGAALLGAGVFSSLRVSSLQNKLTDDPGYVAYRQGVPRDSEACDAAGRGVQANPPSGATPVPPSTFAGTCDSRDRFQTLQYVFYGAGAAVALTGVYFAFLAPSGGRKVQVAQDRPSWHVIPMAGPSSASVTWAMSF